MKPLTKLYADTLIANPKMTQTDAYLATHKTESKATARANASALLKQPNVQVYMKKHEDEARKTIIDVMKNSAILKDEPAHARIASDNAKEILDRNLGRPITKTSSINLNISLEEALNSLE